MIPILGIGIGASLLCFSICCATATELQLNYISEIPLGKPDFMNTKAKKSQPHPEEDPSKSDSEEEWTPKKAREEERKEEMKRGRKSKWKGQVYTSIFSRYVNREQSIN